MYSINGSYIKNNYIRENYEQGTNSDSYSQYKMTDEEKEAARQQAIEQGTYSKIEETSTTTTGERTVSIDVIKDVDIIDEKVNYFSQKEVIDIEKVEEVTREVEREVTYTEEKSINGYKSKRTYTKTSSNIDPNVEVYEACGFDDVNYKKFVLGPGSYPDLESSHGIKRRGGYGVSSMKVPEGASIVVYTEPNFKGSSWKILGPNDLSCLVHQGWNDVIASAIISREQGSVTLWQHCGYHGYSKQFAVGEYPRIEYDYSGLEGKVLNNDISSLKVGSELNVTLYDGHEFTGATKEFSGPISVSCLVDHGWNDRVSSMKVYPKVSKDPINKSLDEWTNALNSSPNKIIRRICQDCVGTHRHIYLKCTNDQWKQVYISGSNTRGDIKNWLLNSWYISYTPQDTQNVVKFNQDFRLHNSYSDAVNDTNKWKYCNANDPGIGFPRDCGPDGYVPYQWNSAGTYKRQGITSSYGAKRVQYSIEAPDSTPENPKWIVLYEDRYFIASEECGKMPKVTKMDMSIDNYGWVKLNGKLMTHFWGNKILNSVSTYPKSIPNYAIKMVYKDPANSFYGGSEIIIYKGLWQVKNSKSLSTSFETIPEQKRINLIEVKDNRLYNHYCEFIEDGNKINVTAFDGRKWTLNHVSGEKNSEIFFADSDDKKLEIKMRGQDTGGPAMVFGYFQMSDGNEYYTDSSWEVFSDEACTQKLGLVIHGDGTNSPYGWYRNWNPSGNTRTSKCKYLWISDSGHNSDGPYYFRKIIDLTPKNPCPEGQVSETSEEIPEIEIINDQPPAPGQSLWKYVKKRDIGESRFSWSGRIYNCMTGGEECGIGLTDEGGAKHNAVTYLSDDRQKAKVAKIDTPDKYEYKQLGYEVSNYKFAIFEVNAKNDAHIALGEDTNHNGKHYEIVLGGWGNSKSVIRPSNQGANLVTHNEQLLKRGMINGLKWDYYVVVGSNGTFASNPFKSKFINNEVNYWWGSGSVMDSGRGNYIGFRVTGYYKSDIGGKFRFRVRTDDGFVMKLGGQKVIDSWRLQAPTYRYSGWIDIEAGNYYPLELLWYEWGGHACMQLHQQKEGECCFNVINRSYFYSLSQNPAPSKFWISWDNNKLSVGKGVQVGTSQFMSIDTSNYNYNIKYMMVSTGWGSQGQWNVLTGVTEDIDNKNLSIETANNLCNNPCLWYGKKGKGNAKKKFIEAGMCDCSKGEDPFGCNEEDDKCAKAINFMAEPKRCVAENPVTIDQAFSKTQIKIIYSKDNEITVKWHNGRPDAKGPISATKQKQIADPNDKSKNINILYNEGSVNFTDDRVYNFWYYQNEAIIYWDEDRGTHVWRGIMPEGTMPEGCIPPNINSKMNELTNTKVYSESLRQEINEENNNKKEFTIESTQITLDDDVNLLESDIIDPKVKEIMSNAWPSYFSELEKEAEQEKAKKKLEDEGGELTAASAGTELSDDAVGPEEIAGNAYYCSYNEEGDHTFVEGEPSLSSAKGYLKIKNIQENFMEQFLDSSSSYYSILGSYKNNNNVIEHFDANITEKFIDTSLKVGEGNKLIVESVDNIETPSEITDPKILKLTNTGSLDEYTQLTKVIDEVISDTTIEFSLYAKGTGDIELFIFEYDWLENLTFKSQQISVTNVWTKYSIQYTFTKNSECIVRIDVNTPNDIIYVTGCNVEAILSVKGDKYTPNNKFINCKILDPYPEGAPLHTPGESFDIFTQNAKNFCDNDDRCSGFLLVTPSAQGERDKLQKAKNEIDAANEIKLDENQEMTGLTNDKVCGMLGTIPNGNVIENVHESNPDITSCGCKDACADNENCNGWYYYKQDGQNYCYLKDGLQLEYVSESYYGALNIDSPNLQTSSSRRGGSPSAQTPAPVPAPTTTPSSSDNTSAGGISLIIIIFIVCFLLVYLVLNKMYK